MADRDEVANSPGDPGAGFIRTRQLETPEAAEKTFVDSGRFASLGPKFAAGIGKVAQVDLGRTISNTKEKFAIQGIFVKRRQAARMIYDHYKVSETDGAL